MLGRTGAILSNLQTDRQVLFSPLICPIQEALILSGGDVRRIRTLGTDRLHKVLQVA